MNSEPKRVLEAIADAETTDCASAEVHRDFQTQNQGARAMAGKVKVFAPFKLVEEFPPSLLRKFGRWFTVQCAIALRNESYFRSRRLPPCFCSMMYIPSDRFREKMPATIGSMYLSSSLELQPVKKTSGCQKEHKDSTAL
jgi:hypothetical protein